MMTRQQVVEIVGDAAGQLTDRLHLLRLDARSYSACSRSAVCSCSSAVRSATSCSSRCSFSRMAASARRRSSTICSVAWSSRSENGFSR